MQRPAAIAGSGFFLVLAPGTVAGLIPWLLCRWQLKPPLLGFYSLRWAGVLLIAGALPVLLDSFRRFALEGLGTPAPVAPTEHLVVSGMYRYVRNPMYMAVVSLIFGQGLLLGNMHVLEYGLAVWLVMHLFVLGYEEPVLHARYGAEYDEFRAHVRRWIPRVRPWKKQFEIEHQPTLTASHSLALGWANFCPRLRRSDWGFARTFAREKRTQRNVDSSGEGCNRANRRNHH